MRMRILAANVQPYDVIQGATVATVIGHSHSVVYISAYRADGKHVALTFAPWARVTIRREQTCR